MIEQTDVDLVVELRSLLLLAETDENEALDRLHALIDTHGRATVGAALTVAAPTELARLAAPDTARIPEQPSTKA
ncbi:hypothetical protein [Saccharopolyspora sp. SCSIO 74807]|uniref:hypothetical protein n=1 Tax=Saccharopolyspora sp. SCSIO 74807 TaxID=3118084 RepID=UPI0030CB2104